MTPLPSTAIAKTKTPEIRDRKSERSWITYDWANSAFTLCVTTAILPIYFKDVAAAALPGHVSTAYWGYANTLATFCVALAAPLLGTLSDFKGFKKPLFIGFVLWGVISCAGLAWTGQSEWAQCLLLFTLASIGFSAANVLYDAFLPDVASKQRMDWVSASGYAWGYIGSTIPFLMSMAFILGYQKFGFASSASATRASFLLVAAWWLVFSLPMFLNVKQKFGQQAILNPVRQAFARLFSTLKSIRRHRGAFLFLAAYFFYIDGVYTIIKMSAVFGKDQGLSSQTLLAVLLVVQWVAFPSALAFGALSKRLPVKSLLLFCVAMYVGVTFYAGFMDSALDFWILGIAVGMVGGGIQSLSRSAFGKLIPPEQAGEFYGFYNIFGRFASVMGPLIVAFVSQVLGSSRLGVMALMVLFIIGGLILWRVPLEEGSRTRAA